MINSNEIENSNISEIIENKNENIIEYEIQFKESFLKKLTKFIETFHTSYEIFLNKLLVYHLDTMLGQIKSKNYELLSFYYFCIDEIFSDNEVSNCESNSELDIQTKNLSIKLNPEISVVVKIICEEIHYKPEEFIKKAIQYQWESIGNDIEAGYYYIINDFSNITRINQTLEKALKASKSDSKIQKKIEGVKRPGNKSKQ